MPALSNDEKEAWRQRRRGEKEDVSLPVANDVSSGAHLLPISFRLSQVQVKCFSGDRFGGHAGEWLPQRLLRLRRVPAADHPEVSCFCHVVAFLSLTCGVHNCGLCFAHHGVHDTRMGQSWF